MRKAAGDSGTEVGETKSSPRSARVARGGPAPPCAPNRPGSCRHRRGAAKCAPPLPGLPDSPPTTPRPRTPPSRFPPDLGAARLGTKREGAPGAAAGRGPATPLRTRREPLGGAPLPSPRSGRALPRTSGGAPRPIFGLPTSSPASPWDPAPGPLLLSRPCGRPSPGGGFPRSRLLRRASARPAGRGLMCPASPSPSPSPSPLLHLLRRCRLRLSLQPRQKPLPPPPPPAPAPAAGTRGKAPAHCALRWGRGHPAAARERGARGTWRSSGRGRPGTRGKRRERQLSAVESSPCSRIVRDAGEARRACESPAWSLDPGWAQTSLRAVHSSKLIFGRESPASRASV